MQPITFTKALTGANDAAIAANQTLGAAGNMTLTASPVVLDTLRQVVLTFAADETGHNFTLYGTDGETSGTISETIAGTTAGTATSVRMYKTISRIAVDAATTGNVKAGTNGVGATRWFTSNSQIAPSAWSFACVLSGTANFTVQVTYDDFWSIPAGQSQGNVPTAWDVSSLANKSATAAATVTDVISGWRLLINSGTGTVTMSAIQAGIAGNM
jgi:hypothetical protein